MSFAIVILSYNHPQLTAKCVSSCIEKYKAQDIFLVHNGSLKQHRDKLMQEFPLVQHLDIENNKGFAGGSNYGIQYAFQNYDWVFFITNDCELIEISKLPEKPGLYAPKILKRNTDKIDSLGGVAHPMGGQLAHSKTGAGINYVPGTAFLIHKDIFKKGYRFDERLHTYWEDVNLSLELKKSEFTVGIVENFILKHKIGKTCHKDKFYTSYLYQRNKGIVCRQHCKGLESVVFEFKYLKDISHRALKFCFKKNWKQALLLCKAYKDSYSTGSYSTTLSAAETAS